jgi:hypothetical protein
MRTFKSSSKISALAIESRSPREKFFYSRRSFSHENLRRSTGDYSIARCDRVLAVERNILLPAHRHRNTALRILRVRFGQLLLRHNQHSACVGEAYGSSKASNARANYDEVDPLRKLHDFLRLPR